jgi:hypothetical protein
MNTETLNRANELANLIEEKEKALNILTFKVRRRQIKINEHKDKKIRYIPFPNWFCVGVIKNAKDNKVTLEPPLECEYPINFELDEECVEFIIKHEAEKIEQLKKELEEL